jgi:regulator of protease activity HflC (stomatin/prohibitin superfamily)
MNMKQTSNINDKVTNFSKRLVSNLVLFLLAIMLIILSSLPLTFKNVGAGEVGVLWERFNGGTNLKDKYAEGFHLIYPWDKFYVYSIRLQEHSVKFNTISSDGLNMVVEIAVRYRIDPRLVSLLHKHVGQDYLKILVDPAVGAYARELISLYTPEELYKSARSFIQNQITERLNRDNLLEIEEAGGMVSLLSIEDVLVREITMPSSVIQAIERKAEQNQLMLEYQYRLQREELEKKRRQTEAEGLKAYTDAMPDGISKSYLMLRSIDATLELAKSANSKVIVFGGSETNNLPLIANSMLNELSADKRFADIKNNTPQPSSSNSNDTNLITEKEISLKDGSKKINNIHQSEIDDNAKSNSRTKEPKRDSINGPK